MKQGICVLINYKPMICKKKFILLAVSIHRVNTRPYDNKVNKAYPA